jgi:hypothetical protein
MCPRVGRFPDRNPATIKLTQGYYGQGITIPIGLIQKVELGVNGTVLGSLRCACSVERPTQDGKVVDSQGYALDLEDE